MAVSANRLELLQIADAVAREKAIDRGIVIAAMEDAIQKAARSRYGSETEVRAEINPKTGEMRLSRLLLVVDQIENDSTQIAVEDAKKRNPAAQVGDYIAEALPPLEYGRIAAQSAKQVIVQKVREAERDRQYQEYKDRIFDIVNGIVKRVEYGNVIVDLGRGEAIVRRDELLPRETFRNGDRIRAFIYDVRREPRGPQIFLSRTHPQFMAKLFAQEVPEIYDGIVEVKAVARDPGSRAKIATAWKWSFPTSSSRLRSAGADKMSDSPHSLPAGTSTSLPSRKSRSTVRPNSKNAPSCSLKRSTSMRWSASCSLPRGSTRSRSSPWWTQRRSRQSRVSMRRPRANCRRAPATISLERKPSSTKNANNSVSRTRSRTSRVSPPPCW